MKLKCKLIGHNWIWETETETYIRDPDDIPSLDRTIINYGSHKAICVRCLKEKTEIVKPEPEIDKNAERVKLFNSLKRKKDVKI